MQTKDYPDLVEDFLRKYPQASSSKEAVSCRIKELDDSLNFSATLPVDLESLFPACGIVGPVLPDKKMKHSGTLQPTQDRKKLQILTPTNQSKVRQRFSIAHELIHTFFRPTPKELDFPRTSREERLCDFGASQLLLPVERFRDHVSKVAPVRPRDLEDLSGHFQVSLEAVMFEVVRLNRFFKGCNVGFMIFDFKRTGEHFEPELRRTVLPFGRRRLGPTEQFLKLAKKTFNLQKEIWEWGFLQNNGIEAGAVRCLLKPRTTSSHTSEEVLAVLYFERKPRPSRSTSPLFERRPKR